MRLKLKLVKSKSTMEVAFMALKAKLWCFLLFESF